MTARLDLYASQRHYIDHLAPIWAALPDDRRGTAWVVDPGDRDRLPGAVVHDWPRALRPSPNPVMVASYRDLEHAVIGRPDAVFVEHGVGQTYRPNGGRRHPAYPGGAERDRVGMFICPNERVAAANLDAYPAAACAVVGSPHLAHLAHVAAGPVQPASRSAAFTFHWDCQVAPETRSTLPYWAPWLAVTRRALPDWRLYGTKHPLAVGPEMLYRGAGITYVAEMDDLVPLALVLVADNSSAVYEWAALGRPVVLLNAPTYRRDVDHGLRFWEYADVGPQVDDPDLLPAAIEDALSPRWRHRRREVVADLFGRHPDPAAEASQAIQAYLDTVTP